jgi:hypothetical protein
VGVRRWELGVGSWELGAVSFRVPFRFRVNYVSENTSAHNAHQKPKRAARNLIAELVVARGKRQQA